MELDSIVFIVLIVFLFLRSVGGWVADALKNCCLGWTTKKRSRPFFVGFMGNGQTDDDNWK